MFNYSAASAFNKDVKLMQKRNKDMRRLYEVMRILINGDALPPKYRNHRLRGNYTGKWECHVEPDWLLIYAIDTVAQEIVFCRTGSHSDLF